MSQIKLSLAVCFQLVVTFGFSQERIIPANSIEICAETFGESHHSPLLLIMGGGCQGIMWPQEFCEKLAGNGFFVIRYDNRDTGLSSAIDYDQNPYDLMDMAKDAVGILDYFGIEQAHIVGTSMGGLIAQFMAAYFPERVKTATLLSTSNDFSPLLDAFEGKANNSSLSKPKDSYLSWMRSIIKNSAQTDQEKMAQHLEGWKILNGSSVKFDEDLYKKLIAQQLNRMKNPSGVGHHISAMQASLEQAKIALNLIKTHTLIIHGTEDPIFALDHGQALQKAVAGSKLVVLEGMGHNLNTRFYDAIISNIKLAEERQHKILSN